MTLLHELRAAVILLYLLMKCAHIEVVLVVLLFLSTLLEDRFDFFELLLEVANLVEQVVLIFATSFLVRWILIEAAHDV